MDGLYSRTSHHLLCGSSDGICNCHDSLELKLKTPTQTNLPQLDPMTYEEIVRRMTLMVERNPSCEVIIEEPIRTVHELEMYFAERNWDV